MVTWIENSEKWAIAVSYMVAVYSRTVILDTWQKLYHCHAINVTAQRDHMIWKVIEAFEDLNKNRRKDCKIAFFHHGCGISGWGRGSEFSLFSRRGPHSSLPIRTLEAPPRAQASASLARAASCGRHSRCGSSSRDWQLTTSATRSFAMGHHCLQSFSVKSAMPTAYFGFHSISISH